MIHDLEIKKGFAYSAKVSMYTITGKQVYYERYSNTENISFSVKNYLLGIYFVKLNQDE